MKCIKCNKCAGLEIQGIKKKYGICIKCLNELSLNYVTVLEKENENNNTEKKH